MRVDCVRNYGLTGFSGRDFFLHPGKSMSVEDINREKAQTARAKKFGVSAPEYTTRLDRNNDIVSIEYSVKGDVADPKTNAISKKHLKSLFKNFYQMDRAGLFHNDFDKSHVFLDRDGGVEFDCFRYSFNFTKKPDGTLLGNDGSIRVQDYVMPSNENAFEEQYLGEYVSGIENDTQKRDFVKNYLREKSYYHKKRADMLIHRGFDPSSKTVEYENIQSKALENPTEETVSYTIDKLETFRQKRAAFTEWDEGGGACGHKVDPDRRFKAVDMHFDCIIAAAETRDRAKSIAEHSNDETLSEYFTFETENMEQWLKNLCDDTAGMGGWTFNDTQNDIYLSTQEDKRAFQELCDEIDTSKSKTEIARDAKAAQRFYCDLALYWLPRDNEKYKAKFLEGGS